nr:ribonuclease H2 subunit A [Tanacetum cinerariifolium]
MSPGKVSHSSFSVRCIPGDTSPGKPIPGDKSPGIPWNCRWKNGNCCSERTPPRVSRDQCRLVEILRHRKKRKEELFESLKLDEKIGWAIESKINLNEISHESAMGLVKKVLDLGCLLTEFYVDTVGDPEKYRIKLSERFPSLFIFAPEVGAVFVTSLAGVLDLVDYSSSDSDPSENSLPPATELPQFHPFCVLMTRRRTVSPSLVSRVFM